jgi:hypothetical protein
MHAKCLHWAGNDLVTSFLAGEYTTRFAKWVNHHKLC